jgi:hypothetical protein
VNVVQAIRIFTSSLQSNVRKAQATRNGPLAGDKIGALLRDYFGAGEAATAAISAASRRKVSGNAADTAGAADKLAIHGASKMTAPL